MKSLEFKQRKPHSFSHETCSNDALATRKTERVDDKTEYAAKKTEYIEGKSLKIGTETQCGTQQVWFVEQS